MSEIEKDQPKILYETNYPSLNRKDLMSLSTITSRDASMKPFKKLDTKRDWSVNLYNLDIEGSSPTRFGALNQKIDFINKNDDIERSCPKILHVGLNKPEYNLRNDDIEFSKPGCVKIKTTRHLNPLEPKYSLSKCEPLPFEVPRFIRDNIQISDIEGAQPREIISKWARRDVLNKDDINGASTTIPYLRKTMYNSIDYRDVTNSMFKTGRMTNPLDPVYKLGYVTGEKVTIGEIEKNKPMSLSKFKYEDPFNLKVNDIPGTSTGSKNFINKFNGKNFIYTSSDIFGAQAGTLKKGIITQRHLHPLVPKYKYLGEVELKGTHENNPYNMNINNKKEGVKEEKKKGQVSSPKVAEREKGKCSPKRESEESNIKQSSPPKQKIEEKLDLEDKPYVEDKIVFDKDKYKKPKPFYGFIHDQYLIPPSGELMKGTNTQSLDGTIYSLNGKSKASNGLNGAETNKGIKVSKENSFGQTYAQKLDLFMSKNNLKAIEPQQP